MTRAQKEELWATGTALFITLVVVLFLMLDKVCAQ